MQEPERSNRLIERLGYRLPVLDRQDRKAILERVADGVEGGEEQEALPAP